MALQNGTKIGAELRRSQVLQLKQAGASEQAIADQLGAPVDRPVVTETTALGAAMLAAIGCGAYASPREAASAMRTVDRRFSPILPDEARRERRAGWKRAVDQVMAGLPA